MLALVAPFVSQCWSADALITCAVPIYVMWAAECSSFVGAWLNCLWSRVLCLTCAIILVVQLIFPLAGDQVCLLAPVVLFTPWASLLCVWLMWRRATACLIPPGPWPRTLSWKCMYIPHMHTGGGRMCTLKWTVPCILVSEVLVQLPPTPLFQVMTFSQYALQLVLEEEYMRNKRRPGQGNL